MARRYYLKLSGTTVVSKIAYDNVAAPASGGYTEVSQAVYDGVTDMNDRTYTFSGGTLSSTAKTLSNLEIRRRAAPDTFEAIESLARVSSAVVAGTTPPSDAGGVIDNITAEFVLNPP